MQRRNTGFAYCALPRSNHPVPPSMQLYVTYTSPYARLARIVVIEKALEDRVEIVGPRPARPTAPTTASIPPAACRF